MAGEVVFAAGVCAKAPKVQIWPKIFDQDSGKNVTSFLHISWRKVGSLVRMQEQMYDYMEKRTNGQTINIGTRLFYQI